MYVAAPQPCRRREAAGWRASLSKKNGFEGFVGFVIMLHELMLKLSQSGPKGNFFLNRTSFS